MKLLGGYINGNYSVKLFSEGTKIRETINPDDNKFIAEFPECFDVKITNYCTMDCEYCHEASSIQGKHGDIMNPKFIDTLRSYTEMAIGGGSVTDHPDLIPFLYKLKEKNIIANITVNQYHFERGIELIDNLIKEKLIYGLGVSLVKVNNNLINLLKQYPNAVLHVINGIVDINELKKLYGHGFKILILGYKQFRKGKDFYSSKVEENKSIIYNSMDEIIKGFKVVSFDNLAIEQLNVKRLMLQEEWDEFYMGSDGEHTMYIDLVEQKFARCSVSDIRYDLLDDIVDMFTIVKNEVIK